jgi:uncharacterized membrane protein
MKPLIILLSVFGISALLFRLFTGDWNLPFSGNLAMGVMLCFTALGHFLFPKGMAMMIPPIVPFRTELVYITGVAEIAFGIALLFTASRTYAGYGLLIFFIAILPANIYAALHHIDLEKGTTTGPGPSYLWFRIPLQVLFIAWICYFSLPLFSWS